MIWRLSYWSSLWQSEDDLSSFAHNEITQAHRKRILKHSKQAEQASNSHTTAIVLTAELTTLWPDLRQYLVTRAAVQTLQPPVSSSSQKFLLCLTTVKTGRRRITSINKMCGRPPQYARPCDLDLLTLKVVSESRVIWPTSVPILVFLGLSVLDLGQMYTTDRQTYVREHHRLMPPHRGGT